jgi:preprotein translocase subunit SecF
VARDADAGGERAVSVTEAERPDKGGPLHQLYQCTNDFDFIKTFRIGLIIGAVICVVSIGSLVTRGLNLGIDFEGGGVWEVPVNDVSVDDARDVLEPLGAGDAKIQTVTDADGDQRIRVQSDISDPESTAQITTALADMAGTTTEEVTVNTVGPSWGQEITRQAVRALIFFFIAVSLYISFRLEWKMAVGALVSMVHDLLLSVGVYSIFAIEVTPATLISFLTILGYSLYDTIVVFDRAQENGARTVAKTPYRYIMNRTLNQTLMRSVNTTLATILPIVSMLVVGALLLGAETLEEFALALLIGLTSGAYSSLFIAAPLVSYFKEREPKFAYTGEVAPATLGGPADGDATAITPRAAKRAGTARRPAAPATPQGAIPPRPRKKKR